MLSQLFNSPFLYSLSLTLVHFLWQGMLVALILKSMLYIVDKNKSKLRYTLATFAMLANAILAILTFSMVYPDTGTVINSNLGPIPLTSLVNELTQQNALLTYQELLPSILAYSLPYLSLLWLATVAILASKLLIEIRNVNNLPLQASISPSSELLIRFDELAKQIKLVKTPKLLISLKAEVPMAIGWLKPVVLLPASMVTGLNSAQLEMLILHELAHIRRHDYLVNFLQTLIELLFFFHPSVHWIGKQMRNEREYCSDDIAVQHCGDAIAYAHTLTDTASLCAKGHFHTIPAMAMAASGGDLKARVIRLVDHHCAPTNNTSKWLAATSLLLALTLLSINQLLTMPFSQQLNSQFPWQDNNNTKNRNVFQPKEATLAQDNLIVDREVTVLTEDTIAQQLLRRDAHNTRIAILAINDNQIHATKTLKNELALNTTIIEPLSFYSESIKNDSDNQTRPLKQRKNDKKEQVSIVEPKVALQEPALQKANKAQIKHDVKTSEKSIQATKDIKSNPLRKVTPITFPSVEVIQQTQFSQIKTDLPVHKSYSHNRAVASTLYNEDLVNKGSAYQQLSYREEINTLATKNKLYQESYAVSPLKKPLDSKSIQLASHQVAKPAVSLNAKLLHNINPVYPSLAKRRGIEMEVKVNFTIDSNGRVKDINFAHQSKLVYFKSSIRSAIRKWRFSPATINNRSVESKMSKIFSFSLEA
jgi:TonB family protein